VKPAPFVHHAPRTVDETVAVLAEVGHDGKVLAGGQSLIPVLNMRLASPGHLVDINGVTGLDAVAVTGSWVRAVRLWQSRSQMPSAGLSEEQAKAVAEVVVDWVKDEDKRKKILAAAVATTIASAVVTVPI